ncbi:MAG TPA: hypothetical protein VF623_13360 [Segetibacter sp.]|jgi:hypothetical protein
MKNEIRLFLFILLVISVTSCRKQTYFYDFSGFRNRYLVCDSMRVTNEQSDKNIILGKGRGFDAMFGDKYTLYSNPTQIFDYTDKIEVFKYKDQQYSKIYFSQGGNLQLGDYFIIEFVLNNHVTLLHKNFIKNEQIRYYYTAE